MLLCTPQFKETFSCFIFLLDLLLISKNETMQLDTSLLSEMEVTKAIKIRVKGPDELSSSFQKWWQRFSIKLSKNWKNE